MAEEHWVQRAQERVGRVLRQKWRLDRLLGVGGMAAVYAATHRNGKRAAVKVLHAEHAINSDLRTRFLREGYVANTVDHSGTVSVLDDDTDEDGCVYLVMELLEGETLEARWERKGNRLDPGEVLSVTDKLLDVLAAAHDKHVIHRDLKPENVFLTRTGVVKVLDFGIARLLEMSAYSSRTTRAGSAMGTPAFMPPEQAAGDWDAVDERTDLWAVGAVMFTLISGRFVHEGRNLNEQLIASATKPAISLGVVAPNVPPAVVAFVDRALAFRKTERWPDARMMQLALREAYWAKDKEARRASRAEMYPPVDRMISIHMPAANVASLEKDALAEEKRAAQKRAAASGNPLEVAAEMDGPPTDEKLEASGASDALTDPDATVFDTRMPNLAASMMPPPLAASIPPPSSSPPAPPAEGADVEEEDGPTLARSVSAFDPTVPLELRGSMKHALRERLMPAGGEGRPSNVPSSGGPNSGSQGSNGVPAGSFSARSPESVPIGRPSGSMRASAEVGASSSRRSGYGAGAGYGPASGYAPASGSPPSSPRVGAARSGDDDVVEDVDEESVAVFRLERPVGTQARASVGSIDVKQIRVLGSGGPTMDGLSASAHPLALRTRARWKLLAMGAAVALLGLFGIIVLRVTQTGGATAVAGAAPEPSPQVSPSADAGTVPLP